MPTTVGLEYFRTDNGIEMEDDEGNPLIVYQPKHMYTSEITSAHNTWIDAIYDVCEFMGIEVAKIERLKPKEKKVYRVHTPVGSTYTAVWAKIRKD